MGGSSNTGVLAKPNFHVVQKGTQFLDISPCRFLKAIQLHSPSYCDTHVHNGEHLHLSVCVCYNNKLIAGSAASYLHVLPSQAGGFVHTTLQYEQSQCLHTLLKLQKSIQTVDRLLTSEYNPHGCLLYHYFSFQHTVDVLFFLYRYFSLILILLMSRSERPIER